MDTLFKCKMWFCALFAFKNPVKRQVSIKNPMFAPAKLREIEIVRSFRKTGARRKLPSGKVGL